MYEVTFTYQEASANLVVWDDGKTATLHTIQSKYRGRGAGTKVMELALNFVDMKGLDVVLSVMPFGDGPKMNSSELKSWYMTFGFNNSGDNTMLRVTPSKELN